MKDFKWRVVLPLFNLLLTVFLLYLGRLEFLSLLRAEGTHYGGSAGYIPEAEKLSYMLNMPAVVATAPLRHSFFGQFTIGVYYTSSHIIYCVGVFLLWWLIGWRIDFARFGNSPSWLQSSQVVVSIDILGGLFSLAMIYAAIDGFFGNFGGGKGLLTFMLLWGVLLLSCFCIDLLRRVVRKGSRQTRFDLLR